MRFRRHLVLFVKAPRIGRVKTRLAAAIGPVRAWAFYRRMLTGPAWRLARDRRWLTWIAVTPDRTRFVRRQWPRPWPRRCHVVSQGTGDLGRRMARAFHHLPPGPAVIVGADIPGVTRRHVWDAFRALGTHDAVFGPATDGGYWLVGFRRRPRFIDPFRNVRWSTKHALADTLANLAPGRSHALLETLQDIDDGADYAAWRRKGTRKGISRLP